MLYLYGCHRQEADPRNSQNCLPARDSRYARGHFTPYSAGSVKTRYRQKPVSKRTEPTETAIMIQPSVVISASVAIFEFSPEGPPFQSPPAAGEVDQHEEEGHD